MTSCRLRFRRVTSVPFRAPASTRGLPASASCGGSRATTLFLSVKNLVVVAVAFTVFAIRLGAAEPRSAGESFPEYSLQKTFKTAEAILPSDKKKQYLSLNLLEPASAKTVKMAVDALLQAAKSNVSIAVMAPRDDYAFATLEQALGRTRARLDGLTLLIVTDKPDEGRYQALFKRRGVRVVAGSYLDERSASESSRSGGRDTK